MTLESSVKVKYTINSYMDTTLTIFDGTCLYIKFCQNDCLWHVGDSDDFGLPIQPRSHWTRSINLTILYGSLCLHLLHLLCRMFICGTRYV